MVLKAKGLKMRMAETLELPKDVVMNVPKLTLIGNVQLSIENHRGIIQYDINSIRINTNIGVYKITGEDLVIKSIVAEEIIISGNIENIDVSS